MIQFKVLFTKTKHPEEELHFLMITAGDRETAKIALYQVFQDAVIVTVAAQH